MSAYLASTTTDTNKNRQPPQQQQQQEEFIHLRSHSNLDVLNARLASQAWAHAQNLTVVCPGCEPDWTSVEITTLFQSLRHIPRLQHLKLNCVGLLDVAFPLRLLTQVLTHTSATLQSLELDDVVLTTTTTTTATPSQAVVVVTELVTAIQQRQLSEFRLFGCLADDTLQQPSSLLDPLWASLASLKRVELDAVDDGLLGSIQAETVGQLARSTTLQHFHLNGFALDNECLLQLADALQHNTTCLEDLSLDLYSVGQPGTGAFALAESLRINSHLKRLQLSISHAWNDETFLKAIARALSTDCTLQSLILGTCAVIRDSTAHAFAEMMVQNCTLERLQLSRYAGEWKPILSYYLLLNRQQRGYFHKNYGSLSRRAWMEGLDRVRDDLDGLYYFLQMNPSVYCGESQTSF